MRTRVLFLVTGAFLVASASGAAQSHATDRGVWLLDGSASLVHTAASGSSSGSTGLGISGAVGYFLIPGVAVSANLQFAHSTASGSSSTLYGIGPGIAYYFGRGAHKVHPFLAVSALFAHQTLSSSGTSTATSHSLAWVGSGGLVFLLARNVGVTGEAYYTQSHFTSSYLGTSSTRTQKQYGTRFGLAVFIY